MATKFDPKDYARQKLLLLCTKYFPKDYIKINVGGRKGFRLGESTANFIDLSEEIISESEESNFEIPESTANFYRYGMVIKDIFQNISNYQTISYVKSRSRRGYRKQLEVVDFNLRKIEQAFKKSSPPPVKIQKDEKIIKSSQKFFLSIIEENRYNDILEDVIKQQNLFIIEESEGRRFFDSLSRLINNLIEIQNERKKLEGELDKTNTNILQINSRLDELNKKIPDFKNQIETQRKRYGILEILGEKEELLLDPNLSLFLKILTHSIERYIKMMERRESRPLEQKEDLLGLVLKPTRFQGLDEDLWRQIVFIIETHGVELLSGKSWFKFENSEDLRQFIVNKDVLEKYAQLRKIEDQFDKMELELQNDPDYSKATQIISEFDEKKILIDNLKEDIPELDKKITLLSQELENEKKKIVTILH